MVTGPKPKDPEKRLRTNEPTFPTRDLAAGVRVKAPALRGASKFRSETRHWWKTWCESEQAQMFLATDWQRLQMLALVVDDFYAETDPRLRSSLFSEIRLNEGQLGATAESRLRLRWQVSEKPVEAPVKQSVPRRRDPRLALVKESSG